MARWDKRYLVNTRAVAYKKVSVVLVANLDTYANTKSKESKSHEDQSSALRVFCIISRVDKM